MTLAPWFFCLKIDHLDKLSLHRANYLLDIIAKSEEVKRGVILIPKLSTSYPQGVYEIRNLHKHREQTLRQMSFYRKVGS